MKSNLKYSHELSIFHHYHVLTIFPIKLPVSNWSLTINIWHLPFKWKLNTWTSISESFSIVSLTCPKDIGVLNSNVLAGSDRCTHLKLLCKCDYFNIFRVDCLNHSIIRQIKQMIERIPSGLQAFLTLQRNVTNKNDCLMILCKVCLLPK